MCGVCGIKSDVEWTYFWGLDSLDKRSETILESDYALLDVVPDSDGDGVLDVDDLCPDSDTTIVDADGCSIDQLCECEADWKNHGQYVRCVARTAEDFIYDGIITEEEKDAIVSERASNDCGKK